MSFVSGLTQGFGFQNAAWSGLTTVGRQVLPRLNAYGMVNLNGTTINGGTVINGTLHMIGSILKGTLNMNGTIQANECQIDGLATINGMLEAQKTTFNGGISISSDKITFNESSVKGDITVRKSHQRHQVMVLSNSSVISGNVVFEAGQGIIQLSGGSRIEGQVRGAVVESQNDSKHNDEKKSS